MKGIVTKFDTGRKFGFIRPSGGGSDDVFFHQDEVKSGGENLKVGCTASFDIVKSEKGPRAVGISISKPAPVSPYSFFAGGAIFLTAVCSTLTYMYAHFSPLLSYGVGVNVALFALCGFDKAISGGTTTRVPEKILFFFAAIGGSVGLLLGMNFFRHKTQKSSFQFAVAVIVFAQVALIRYAQTHFDWFHLTR